MFPRPSARPGPCVFCEGQEARTPEEVWALRPTGGAPNSHGWLVRVVPNRFPALRIEGDLEPSGEGLYDRMNGVGAHEVVIEAPKHDARIEQLPVSHLATVLLAYRERILDLAKDPRIEYVMVFKNQGEAAGASLEHAHSQLIATPIVPMMVDEELAGGLQHFRIKHRCIWCDIVRQEGQGGGRVVLEQGGLHGPGSLRAEGSVRDVDPSHGPSVRVRGHAGRRIGTATRPCSRSSSAG